MTRRHIADWIIPGVEGGSDSWERPPLPAINPKKDTISNALHVARHSVTKSIFLVFQQIDIDEATGSTGIIIRLFGITQVRR